ncbi:hypothetical protein GEMRC1_006318 [Eukaryota sp. GEM-RC1]
MIHTSVEDEALQIFSKTAPSNINPVLAALSANIASKDSELQAVIQDNSNILLECVEGLTVMQNDISSCQSFVNSLHSTWSFLETPPTCLSNLSSLPLCTISPMESISNDLHDFLEDNSPSLLCRLSNNYELLVSTKQRSSSMYSLEDELHLLICEHEFVFESHVDSCISDVVLLLSRDESRAQNSDLSSFMHNLFQLFVSTPKFSLNHFLDNFLSWMHSILLKLTSVHSLFCFFNSLSNAFLSWKQTHSTSFEHLSVCCSGHEVLFLEVVENQLLPNQNVIANQLISTVVEHLVTSRVYGFASSDVSQSISDLFSQSYHLSVLIRKAEVVETDAFISGFISSIEDFHGRYSQMFSLKVFNLLKFQRFQNQQSSTSKLFCTVAELAQKYSNLASFQIFQTKLFELLSNHLLTLKDSDLNHSLSLSYLSLVSDCFQGSSHSINDVSLRAFAVVVPRMFQSLNVSQIITCSTFCSDYLLKLFEYLLSRDNFNLITSLSNELRQTFALQFLQFSFDVYSSFLKDQTCPNHLFVDLFVLKSLSDMMELSSISDQFNQMIADAQSNITDDCDLNQFQSLANQFIKNHLLFISQLFPCKKRFLNHLNRFPDV